MSQDLSNATLFEVSWEVCNKVGGIYAVVSSKILEALAAFGENYFLLGPDLGNNPDFEETDEPCWQELRQETDRRNLSCRFGRWNIPGRPKVILVGYRDRYDQSQLLFSLWNRYGVDSISGGWDYVEPVMFSTACGEVIEAACKALHIPADGPALAHFHEWMCGGGLLYLKTNAPYVGTVFTTHATMLGRSMAGSGFDIYKQMHQINPKHEAGAYNITAKCSMETASAREADCFTTVSRITADEAGVFLGRTPDVLTLNGLDLRVIPDYSRDRSLAAASRQRLLEAAGRLLRRRLPEDTRIFLVSGRYEYHNKGIDVFLDALGMVNTALSQSQSNVLALCAVMGGHSGVNADAVSGDPAKLPGQGGFWISSHHVYNQPNDPILNACQRLGLDNRPENHVQVIFDPALLDGKDGFLNMRYEEVLAACDLGVFPSWYEPWGYTPQESAAHAVPTVTTDLSGFGMWVRSSQRDKNGVTIICRRQTSYDETAASLRDVLLQYASLPEEQMQEHRHMVRHVAEGCSWEQFFPYYVQAYGLALDKARQRSSQPAGGSTTLTRVLAATMSTTPNLHSFTALTSLPPAIGRLRELAHNLWWSWHPECHYLFSALNEEEWERSNHNPIATLEKATRARLIIVAHEQSYLRLYNQTMAAFDAYMAEAPQSFGPLTPQQPLAYFSTEYGLSECLPIYSGGLGVLSGDHLKSASDLNIPLVAVGLLYKNGYFRQIIDKNGDQTPVYPENDFATLPIEQVKDQDGKPREIYLQMPGRRLHVQIWLVRVGRINLYLLDTNLPSNTAEDRKITARLYEADRDIRLRQEILLGRGGVSMLRALDIRPAAYHMNEGHSAFLIFERIRLLMQENGLSFEEAGEVVRGSTLFTTHTPVDAGNERFSLESMEAYFKPYIQTVGISWQTLVNMGRFEGSERNVFEMTALALKYSMKANGVSALHGVVSRHMWQEGWQGVPVAEIPIFSVTNGIHVPSYAGPAMRPLLQKHLGEGWQELTPDDQKWTRIADIPDADLWTARQTQKKHLLEAIRSSLPEFFKKFAIPYEKQQEMTSRLTPETLVIGFARRFAPYKRATLLFADVDRLARILEKSGQPVIFVFAGKAHPADGQGIGLIRELFQHMLSPRFFGKIFFIEDYSLAVSRLMVQGCDVWLNNPRRPYEACGTSGQKVAVNGGLNLSVADGWWCEGYNGTNGWTIGPLVAKGSLGPEQSDYDDAASLYSLLEDKVIPLYFERDADNRPHNWLLRVRKAMQTLIAQYSSHRMLRDYLSDYYIPAATSHQEIRSNHYALARHLSHWKQDVNVRFGSVQMDTIRIEGIKEDSLLDGQSLHVAVTVHPGSMKLDELLVQLVAGPGDGSTFTETPDVVEMQPESEGVDGTMTFVCTYTPSRSGIHVYGVRVMPCTEGLSSPLETRLVLWG
ncbi:alpha-glucan family phosphorylase [Desulfovibrio piger]|uniref:alpha-glucan family phosphorylase n=1 Tax=Desulfovibrio piger TaxID=901 RepID=UPI0026F0E37D|nr:alpha-glucan family phosphorylase [Desulfovibrio piger]MBS5808317.1 alpha-glucan family phosphorylase [Desulfovibrio piger]